MYQRKDRIPEKCSCAYTEWVVVGTYIYVKDFWRVWEGIYYLFFGNMKISPLFTVWNEDIVQYDSLNYSLIPLPCLIQDCSELLVTLSNPVCHLQNVCEANVTSYLQCLAEAKARKREMAINKVSFGNRHSQMMNIVMYNWGNVGHGANNE